jgi:hypothetical protein
MTDCQHVIFKTKSGHRLDLLILKEGDSRFSVLMSLAAFPQGTHWPNAQQAALAALRAVKSLLVQDEIASVAHTTGEFITSPDFDKLI